MKIQWVDLVRSRCSKSTSLNLENARWKEKHIKTVWNDAFNSNVNTVRVCVKVVLQFQTLEVKNFQLQSNICKHLYVVLHMKTDANVYTLHSGAFRNVLKSDFCCFTLADYRFCVCTVQWVWMWVMSVVDWVKPNFSKAQTMSHTRHGSSQKWKLMIRNCIVHIPKGIKTIKGLCLERQHHEVAIDGETIWLPYTSILNRFLVYDVWIHNNFPLFSPYLVVKLVSFYPIWLFVVLIRFSHPRSLARWWFHCEHFFLFYHLCFVSFRHKIDIWIIDKYTRKENPIDWNFLRIVSIFHFRFVVRPKNGERYISRSHTIVHVKHEKKPRYGTE